jgi:hypothetical protein
MRIRQQMQHFPITRGKMTLAMAINQTAEMRIALENQGRSTAGEIAPRFKY